MHADSNGHGKMLPLVECGVVGWRDLLCWGDWVRKIVLLHAVGMESCLAWDWGVQSRLAAGVEGRVCWLETTRKFCPLGLAFLSGYLPCELKA